jgi:hypothetical protein
VGVILFAILLLGCAAGLALSVLLGSVSLAVAFRRAGLGGAGVGRVFAIVSAVACGLALFGVHAADYGPVRGGCDYDLAARGNFLRGLGTFAAPGVAALVGALATLFTPRTRPASGDGTGLDELAPEPPRSGTA